MFIPAKERVVFADVSAPEERNLWYLYKKYASLRPKDGKCNALYWQPLKNNNADI